MISDIKLLCTRTTQTIECLTFFNAYNQAVFTQFLILLSSNHRKSHKSFTDKKINGTCHVIWTLKYQKVNSFNTLIKWLRVATEKTEPIELNAIKCSSRLFNIQQEIPQVFKWFALCIPYSVFVFFTCRCKNVRSLNLYVCIILWRNEDDCDSKLTS